MLSRNVVRMMRPMGVRFNSGEVTQTPTPPSDAFKNREWAQEELYYRKQQAEKLEKLKESLKKSKEKLEADMKELDDHIAGLKN